MGAKCRYCGSSQVAIQDSFITSGLCDSCTEGVLSTKDNTRRFINSFAEPILFMRDDPRQVVTANQAAGLLFGKDLAKIQGRKPGRVFDCAHSLSEAGQGADPECQTCQIKKALKDALAHKKPGTRIYKILEVLREKQTMPYHLEVSTEPIGDYALIRVDRYNQAEV